MLGHSLTPGGWDILPAAIYSEDRVNNVSFAEVFIQRLTFCHAKSDLTVNKH